MAARRNGNGRSGGQGGQPEVPHWVRTLFDQHGARMAALERSHEEHEEQMREMRAEHEERMARLEREDKLQENRLEKTHRLALGILAALDARDKQRARERDALARVLSRIDSRIGRLEQG